jgi:hypothetical protein
MLGRLFPKTIDNQFRGPWAAAWLLGLVVLMKLTMCAGTIFATRKVALGPDGLPVDSVSPAAAAAMLQLLALVGFDQMVLTLVGVIALARYRAMIPLAFLLLLTEQVGRRVIHLTHPTVHGEGRPVGVYINLAILALMLVGFALSLMERRTAAARARRAF